MPGNNNARDTRDERDERDDSEFDPLEYAAMLELERLESLEEDMRDLGFTTLDEIRQRIADLHQRLDARE